MKESELSKILGDQERDSLAYLGGPLSDQRKDALSYYLAEQFPPSSGMAPEKGRSSVVMHEVADTVDWILPSLLKIFASGDNAVEFQANHEEGSDAAGQATAYVNFVFFHDNPGFMILHDFFQDALIQKNGIVKCYWDDKAEDKAVETRMDLPQGSYALLLQREKDGEIEILAHTEHAGIAVGGSPSVAGPTDSETPASGDDGTGEEAMALPSPPISADLMEMLHDVRYREKSGGKCCVEGVVPEEFLISRDAKRIQTAKFVAHRTRVTLSDLIAMGYPKNKVMALPSDDESPARTEEAQERANKDDTGDTHVAGEGVMREVWLTDAYILVDYDGDGLAERRKVVYAGDNQTIFENVEWEGPPPFASVTPKPRSHRFFGQSIADLVMDLQRIKSMLVRSTLDNTYLANKPRHAISDQVNIDDYMTPRLDGFIRLNDGARPGDGHILPIATPFIGGEVLPIVEYFDEVRENRTGVTKYNQGTDANSLNKTATGISQIMSAAQQRIELIARIFAETGVSDLFKLIFDCVAKYQQKSRIIKVNGKWTPVDPSGWQDEFKMQINVGLGTGNKDQQLTHLMSILQIQQQVLMAGNPGGIVQPDNVFNASKKVVENAGLKDPELYFTDPQNAPQQQPKPDPAMAKVESDAKAKQAELQLKAQGQAKELELKQQGQQAEIAMKAKAQQDELALKAQGQMQQHAMAAQGQQMDHQRQVDGAEADRSLQREGMQQEQQGRSDDVSKAVQQVGDMLKEFMASQKERDAQQDQTLQALMAKIMPQGVQPNGAVQ